MNLLAGAPGCLAGQTEVLYMRGARHCGRRIRLDELYRKFNGLHSSNPPAWDLSLQTYLQSVDDRGVVFYNRIVGVYDSGVKPTVTLTLESGERLTCTPDHPILGVDGYKPAEACSGYAVLCKGSMRPVGAQGRNLAARPPRVIVNVKHHPFGARKVVAERYEYTRHARARLVVEAALNNLEYSEFVYALKHDDERARTFRYLPPDFEVHHIDENTLNDRLENLQVLPKAAHAQLHGKVENLRIEHLRTACVVAVEESPAQPTYDIQMEGPANNFAANGMFVHNTGKTAFLAWWITQMSQGASIFGLTPSQIPFQGWITADRSWDRSTVKWFELAGFVDLPHYSLQDDRAFKKSRLRNKRDRLTIFDECLAAISPSGDGKFPRGSMVYVDPLALFLGGNLLDYDTCAVACSEIRERCLDHELAVIGTAHSAKLKADKKDRYLRLQDRILGSAALFGYTDTQLFLASPDELGIPEYTFLWAPHHAKTQTFKMIRTDTGLFVPAEEISEEAPNPVGYLEEALAAAGSEGLSFSQIVEAGRKAKVSRATAYRHLGELIHLTKVQVVGTARARRYRWMLSSVN